MTPRFKNKFAADPHALLDMLAAELDDGMVREIAQADHGYGVDENLPHLGRIRDEGQLPAPLEWHPREVLELIRWSEPENPNWRPGGFGRRGHLMRAFCCTALLRAAADPSNEGRFEEENSTLAQLLDSVSALGSRYEAAELGFLAWRLDYIAPDEERPFFLLIEGYDERQETHARERPSKIDRILVTSNSRLRNL